MCEKTTENALPRIYESSFRISLRMPYLKAEIITLLKAESKALIEQLTQASAATLHHHLLLVGLLLRFHGFHRFRGLRRLHGFHRLHRHHRQCHGNDSCKGYDSGLVNH
jgi:hypothetical protein